MGILVHLHDPFDATKRTMHRLAKPTTVRRLVRKHKGLRRHTAVYGPNDVRDPAHFRRVYGNRRVREFARPTKCYLNGRELKRAEWKRAKVGPRDVVIFWTPPAGGNNGGSNPLMIVAMVAIVVISVVLQQYYLPGVFAGSFGGAIGGVGTVSNTIAATLAATAFAAGASYGLMALFGAPPPQQMQSIGFGTGSQTSPTYNLAIQGNTARLEQPIPEIFGRHRIFPDFVGQPYIRYNSNNDQFIHMGLAIGVGEYEIDEASIRVGDTPITTFDQIIYDIVPPGGVHDTGVWDTRWLPSNDLATVELPGAGADPASPWKGPFIANPPNTVVDRVEIDFAASRGSYAFNPGTGGLDAKTWAADLEARLIDDSGDPLGSWVTLGTFSKTKVSQEPWRWTEEYIFAAAGRWEVRIRRTDTEDESLQAGHQLDWIGMRGRLTSIRRFAGVTCIDVRMKASGDLNSVTSRKINLIVTRKLPTWDLYYDTGMGTELLPTRDPCDAIAYIARSSNGGRIADASIDLAGIYEHRDEFADAGWTFDFVFDQSLTVSEALRRVARAVVAEIVVQGGKLRLVRDVPSLAPVAMFSQRNIRQGTVERSYKAVDSTTADALICTYMDEASWKPKDITIAFDDSLQERPTRLTLHGITNRAQARAVGWWIARQNRYRRAVVKFNTEMEGLGVLFGDPISFSHDMPRWGQTMEVLDWDEDDRIATLSDAPDFSTSSSTHYVAIRDRKGHLAGPFEATAVAGQPYQIVVGAGTLPDIYVGGDEERTFVQFGPGEEYARQLKVKQVSIRSEEEAEILAFDDDARMYDDIPEDDETDAVDFNDVTVSISESVAGPLNLRTVANEAGYVGVLNQAVTITILPGVEVGGGIVRGTWPPDYDMLTLINQGTISGPGGAGGASGYGGNAVGSPGATGGTAFDASTGPVSLNNADGTIRAGGGGGGGGAILNGALSGSVETLYGGGGGGGGQGNAGGAGGVASGSGLTAAGNNGAAGSSSAPGTGGAGAHWTDSLGTFDAPSGGTGGTWGEAGEPGGSGVAGGAAQAGGAGGAGGKAIKGNDNITWVGDQGTIIGTIA